MINFRKPLVIRSVVSTVILDTRRLNGVDNRYLHSLTDEWGWDRLDRLRRTFDPDSGD